MMAANVVAKAAGRVNNKPRQMEGWALRYVALFEAESIQAYLHGSNRMRDAVGASQIVDSLCGTIDAGLDGDDLLSRVLRAIQVPAQGGVRFSRRGGGAFIAFFADADLRDRFRALWALALEREAPGLAWSDAQAQACSDWQAARAGMLALREARLWRAPELPELGPMVLRSSHTGAAAVASQAMAGAREWVDAATQAKRAAGAQAGRITRRFMPDAVPSGPVHWPTRLSADSPDEADELGVFPLGAEQNELAFVHADGNGLGAALQALAASLEQNPAEYVAVYASFSAAISRATVAAARAATQQVLLPARDALGRVPARPLVLGGDDLSIIVRPDLAVDFADCFLRAFEVETARELAPFVARGCPARLSAACGIAVMHARHPFARAAALSEWLCGQAKGGVKRVAGGAATPPASLMLHRETTSLPADDEHWLAGHTFQMPGAEGPVLSLQGGPYTLAPTAGLRRLDALRGLADLLAGEAVSTSGIRQALGQLSQQDDDAACLRTWGRWREALRRRDASALAAIDAALIGLGVQRPAESPFGHDAGQHHSTPLVDALLLASWR